MTTVREILQALDGIAPPHLCLGNDPRGLLIGDTAARVTKVLVALDVTASVVARAQRFGAELIVAHHPLIFHPLKTLLAREPHPGSVALACARAGIAVACAHTNWDVAPGGVNDVLGRLLGLENLRPLRTTYREPLVKLVVFVPGSHHESLFTALTDAGAGAVGGYDQCGFWTEGVGTFRPQAGTNPYVGTVGVHERVAENRLEVLLPEARLSAVLAAMRQAHPYEEIAHDIYPLKNTGLTFGLGRVGELVETLTATDFLARLGNVLGLAGRTLTPTRAFAVQSVAVCGGAGAELMHDAIAAGADTLVTSDIRHHELVEAAERGFLLIDAGHAATETPGARELAVRLATALPAVSVEFAA